MLTSYDFLLQNTSTVLQHALQRQGAMRSPTGEWVWPFASGDVRIVPVYEDTRLTGMEVRVPLKAHTALVTAVLHAATCVAEASGSRLVDLQLTRVVQSELETLVCTSYLNCARHAGEYSALEATAPATPVHAKNSLQTYLVVLLVFFVAMYLTFIHLSG